MARKETVSEGLLFVRNVFVEKEYVDGTNHEVFYIQFCTEKPVSMRKKISMFSTHTRCLGRMIVESS